MAEKPVDQLGELQGAILETVWELGRATVHEVRDQLLKKKQLAYTTVLTGLQRLEKAGLLRHERRGKSHVYLPTSTREQAGTTSIRRLIQNVFRGDSVLMLQHLMADENLSEQELKDLRKVIDKKRRENKK
jgi:BlaI family penicillinase repressor